jgi:hypothetical protein
VVAVEQGDLVARRADDERIAGRECTQNAAVFERFELRPKRGWVGGSAAHAGEAIP